MKERDGRVTILPAQRRRLAELNTDAAIAVVQQGSILHIDDGKFKISIDANGNDIHSKNQEQLC